MYFRPSFSTPMYSPGASPYVSRSSWRSFSGRISSVHSVKVSTSTSSGLPCFREFVVCAERIGAEYGALGLYHPFERRSVGGQAGYVVTGIVQRLQRIVERLHAFDIGRRNGTLAGSFVVVDGDLLLAVGRVVQTGIVLHQTAEFFRVDGNGVEEFHAVALELCGHGVRCDGTVQFGHHDAHRGHAARCHSPACRSASSRTGR